MQGTQMAPPFPSCQHAALPEVDARETDTLLLGPTSLAAGTLQCRQCKCGAVQMRSTDLQAGAVKSSGSLVLILLHGDAYTESSGSLRPDRVEWLLQLDLVWHRAVCHTLFIYRREMTCHR